MCAAERHLFRLRLDGRGGSRRLADNEQLPVLFYSDLLILFALPHALFPHPPTHPPTPTPTPAPHLVFPFDSPSPASSPPPLTGALLSDEAVADTDGLIDSLSCLLSHLVTAPPPVSCMHVIMTCRHVSACVRVRQRAGVPARLMRACVHFSACHGAYAYSSRVGCCSTRACARFCVSRIAGLHFGSPPLPELGWLCA